MAKTPQFFQNEGATKVKGPRSNRAIYKLPSHDRTPFVIAVECADGGGNVPRNAASLRTLAQNVRLDLEAEFEAVAAVAKSVLTSLKELRPGEVEIEFGVELGGELGIPLITKGEAKANFKVTLTWKNGKSEA